MKVCAERGPIQTLCKKGDEFLVFFPLTAAWSPFCLVPNLLYCSLAM